MRMSELLNEVRSFTIDEGFSPREIKMAIGIASDPRYAKGNMTGAVNAIEKMKKGLSKHPQVAAVLKRQNENLDEMVMKYVLINMQGKVQGYASDKKDALDIARRTKSTMHPIKKKITDKTLEKMNALQKTPKELQDLGIIDEAVKEEVNEDGHTDVASAVRQCKTMVEDATQIMSKLQTMSPEESLPSWWTNKLAISSNSMNKLRDYFLVPTNVTEELQEAMGDLEDLKKMVAELEKASEMHLGQSKRVQAHVDMMSKMEETELDEEIIINELKMNDPRLNKIFDKLKPKSTVQIKTSSSIAKGQDFKTYLVVSKNTLRNGTEKITLKNRANPTGVKSFLYRKDDKITFAIGDMGASIDDIKEMAYKPGSFKDTKPQEKAAKKFDDFITQAKRYNDLDLKDYQKARSLYVQASDPSSREKLKKFIYNLDTEPKEVIMNMIGVNDPNTFLQMYPNAKKGQPLSTVSFAHRSMKSEEVELGEAFKPDQVKAAIAIARDNRFSMKGMVDKKTAIEKIAKGLSKDPAVKKVLDKMYEEFQLKEKYDLYHKDFSSAMQHAYSYAKSKMGITIDPKEIDSKVATGPKKPTEGKTNKYRLKGKGGNLQIQVYNKGGSKPFELNMYKEENDLISLASKQISHMQMAEKVDPADVDDDATEKDIENAAKNIIMQLRKSVSMRGNKDVEFASGKQKVDMRIAQKAISMHMKMKPQDKLKFQNTIAKSYKDLLNAVKGK